MYKLLEFFLETNLWRKFARHWMAYFTFRWFGWPKFPKSRYFKVKEIAKAKEGQNGVFAFVSVDKCILNYKVNHFLTGATWGHAGYVYWGDDGELRIKHMLNNGLNDGYLLDLFGELDGFALLWIPLKTKKNIIEFERRVKKLSSEGVEIDYDYSLKLEPDVLTYVLDERIFPNGGKKLKIYCSEFLYTLLYGLNPKFVASVFMKRSVFEPDDLYGASEVIFSETY